MNFGEVKSHGIDGIFTGLLVTGNRTDRCLYNGSKRMTGYSSKKAMSKAAEMMSDKGYTESTLEKQAEFAKQRNYTYEVDLQTLLLRAIKDLTMHVDDLKARVEQLEMYQKDDGK